MVALKKLKEHYYEFEILNYPTSDIFEGVDKFAKKFGVILLLLIFQWCSNLILTTSARRRKRLLSTGCQSSYSKLSLVLSVASPPWR